MRIYFACSITGGRGDEADYERLVAALQADGHEVPNAMIAGSGWTRAEDSPDANYVYERDTAWIDGSQALIAEVSTPSHGVGYEISYALERGKPVLCLHRRDVKVSKMLSGNSMPGIQVSDYGDVAEGIEVMRKFLAQLA